MMFVFCFSVLPCFFDCRAPLASVSMLKGLTSVVCCFLFFLISFFDFFFFFFFQAEDGIRDTSVTGVQTCALPICVRVGSARDLHGVVAEQGADAVEQAHTAARSSGPRGIAPGSAAPTLSRSADPGRSEERRVGKECGSGGGAGDETSKKNKEV